MNATETYKLIGHADKVLHTVRLKLMRTSNLSPFIKWAVKFNKSNIIKDTKGIKYYEYKSIIRLLDREITHIESYGIPYITNDLHRLRNKIAKVANKLKKYA